MSNSIVRTDKWYLSPSPEVKEYLEMTIREYRRFCRALSYVVMGHWRQIAESSSRCKTIEKLIHKTAKNPNPKYKYFQNNFYKFPSYLRRAAIEFVCGQVSSYLSRYRDWQDGRRNRRDARSPLFNPDAGCYPSLYKGNCIKYDINFDNAEIKVWNGRDWVWVKVPIKTKRNRHLLGHSQQLSPQLIVKNKNVHLSVPFNLKPEKLEGEKVCAIDIGINTLATASIVTKSGTVTARKFFHPAADIDRRDKHWLLVSRKARLTKKLHRGFAKDNYRKARQINVNINHQISRKIVNFAINNGASVIVFEQLKGWRPTGGKKRSSLRQRFHGWLHRRLVLLTEQKFQEVGGQIEKVYARGTSSWAYDGSGKVKRNKSNYSEATFASGKQYNADLSASYNIAARYIAYKLKLTRRNDGRLSGGKSSSDKQRMPATLSVLWDKDAPHECDRIMSGSIHLKY